MLIRMNASNKLESKLKRKTGEGILDELAAIVGRVMPQVPNDMIENRETNPIKDNDKQLPKDENKS